MSNTAPLSYRATLKEYQEQAQALFDALKSHDQTAEWRFKWAHPRFRGKSADDVRAATLDVADAQLVIAHEHGFEKWEDVAEFADAVRRDGVAQPVAQVAQFEAAVEAVVAGDIEALRSMLAEHPELVRARSTRRHHATLLHYVAANGVENYRQRTPANAVEVAKLLLDAGAEVDALADMYDHKCTTMSMLVSSCHPAAAGLQVALAELLLDYGAALDGPGSAWQSALMTALKFGYLRTAEALTRRGAPLNHLPVVAGLGRLEDTRRLLPTADSRSKHAALALAAQHGHAEVVRVLLDAGEDPNRFNPDGFHGHATPLHHAALANHTAVVRLLVERGARLDIRDTIYQGTPLDWALHAGHTDIADYLRQQAAKMKRDS
jgi:ankyrin repeat protein